MTDNLPPLPALPPHEVEEWSESFITLRGEGWKKETVEKYAVDYARAALAQAQSLHAVLDIEDLTDRLVAISSAVADDDDRSAQAILRTTLELLSESPQPQPVQASERCPNCDETGDVHSIDGQWRGVCHCPAGKAINAQAKPEQAAQPIAWHTEDHLTDRSATTYDKDMVYRWKSKGWPITPLYAEPPPPKD